MKILDRYILSRFLYNFFSAFFILLVIFIFQGIWLFIDDLAGKGLGMLIISKFLFYFIPTLVDKVLPLTVLIASILTFGNFAENYEFAAMKASGISLQRAMRSLILFVLLLGGVTFFFANTVIPKAEQKIFNLKRNIANLKPAAAITEGVFSNFEGSAAGMTIKVDKKHGEKDRFLDNVIIHKKSPQHINTTVIKARAGELISSEGSDIIQLVLKDGTYYEELHPKKTEERKKYPFAKGSFEAYTITIDISALNDRNLEEEMKVTTDKMKNAGRLLKDIDSLGRDNRKKIEAFSKNTINTMGAFPRTPGKRFPVQEREAAAPTAAQKSKPENLQAYLNQLTPEQQVKIIAEAETKVARVLTRIGTKKKEFQNRFKFYNSHILSFHKKYALAFSCIILFFVGAPLGAIIRKGGLGLPMVIAILLFLTYYFIGVFADNYAKEGNINAVLAAWLATLIMLPLGIWLTRRATTDRGLVSFGSFWHRLKGIVTKKKDSL